MEGVLSNRVSKITWPVRLARLCYQTLNWHDLNEVTTMAELEVIYEPITWSLTYVSWSSNYSFWASILSVTETITEPSVLHCSSGRLNGLIVASQLWQVSSILEGPVIYSHIDRSQFRYGFAFTTWKALATPLQRTYRVCDHFMVIKVQGQAHDHGVPWSHHILHQPVASYMWPLTEC